MHKLCTGVYQILPSFSLGIPDDGRDVHFIRFVRFILFHFSAALFTPFTNSQEGMRMALAVRRQNRRIINEDEVIATTATLTGHEATVLDWDGLTFDQMLSAMAPIELLIRMFGSGGVNCIFLQPASEREKTRFACSVMSFLLLMPDWFDVPVTPSGNSSVSLTGVVLVIQRDTMAAKQMQKILFEGGDVSTARAGITNFLWVLMDPLLSFPLRGGLNSDTLVPRDDLTDVLQQLIPRVGRSAPVGERLNLVWPQEQREDSTCVPSLEEDPCQLMCSVNAGLLMSNRTGSYPNIWPCRAEYADAFVLSDSYDCHDDVCAITIEAYFAEYLQGNITITVEEVGGGKALGQLVHSMGANFRMRESNGLCSSLARLEHAQLTLQVPANTSTLLRRAVLGLETVTMVRKVDAQTGNMQLLTLEPDGLPCSLGWVLH